MCVPVDFEPAQKRFYVRTSRYFAGVILQDCNRHIFKSHDLRRKSHDVARCVCGSIIIDFIKRKTEKLGKYLAGRKGRKNLSNRGM